MGVVRQFYPDKPGVPRTFPGGLDRELGGPGAVPVSRQVYIRDTEVLTFRYPGSYRRGGNLNIHPFIPNSTSFLSVIILIFIDSYREI
jgi:hypothetical protein